jgi:hypothetical protein
MEINLLRRLVVAKTAAFTMKLKHLGSGLSLVTAQCIFPLTTAAQQNVGAEAASVYTASPVPQLVNYGGLLANIDGNAFTRVSGVTFLRSASRKARCEYKVGSLKHLGGNR